jgi:hypothetical protein
VITKQVKGYMPSKAGLSKHAAVDRLRSYARGRNERLSTMAAKSSRTTCARPLVAAPAVGRTTAQQQ